MKVSFIKKYKPTTLEDFCFDNDMLTVLELLKNMKEED